MKTNPKILTGIVVSDRLSKTVVVEVERLIKHPKYGKYIRRSKRYLAHHNGGHQVGDRVKIEETRPYSRHKHFKVQ
ncbi:MAG: 30S ribosomal protein S17 [Candidatus Vogelbacteria bacterium]|nr:30S ribosomal protein S17 [Candidatus Vogelbacteria bacterium]